MKKIISILFIAFLSLFLTTFVVGVKAEDNKSVEASSTPNISSATIDGVEGEISYTIMSYEEAATKTNDSVASFLISAKDELENTKVKNSDAVDYKKIDASLDKELTELAKEINTKYTSKVFVPEKIFELSVENGILTGNNKVKFVFDLEATEGKYTVIHKDTTSEKWLVIPKEDVKVEDGKLAVYFSSLCPVAFLTVNPDMQFSEAPAPNIFTYVLIGVSACLVILDIILIVTSKKKRKSK